MFFLADMMRLFDMASIDMANIEISSSGKLLISGEALWNLNTREEIHTLKWDRSCRLLGLFR